MRFWISPYELHPRKALSSLAGDRARRGALLRVEFAEGVLGYSDLHPWPELGDAPLGIQIKRLSSLSRAGRAFESELKLMASPLIQSSIDFARQDALARSQGKSLWSLPSLESAPSPKCHFLLPYFATPKDLEREIDLYLDQASALGMRKFKLKLPGDPSVAADLTRALALKLPGDLPRERPLRVDFNSSLNAEGYARYLSEIPDLSPSIDFIEDPVSWTEEAGELRDLKAPPLAVDRDSLKAAGSPFCPPVVVIKPAVQNWRKLGEQTKAQRRRAVFTSYLDHPLGQLFATWAAHQSEAAPPETQDTHGLASHLVYENNAFSEQLTIRQGRILPPPLGRGIGFDLLLERLDWSENA